MAATIGVAFSQFTPPENSISLGLLGDGTRALDFNTFASVIDTELGLFNSRGDLLLENDDANGTLQSQIVTPTLAEGTYYLAAGQYPATFGAGFFASGPTGGEIILGQTVGGRIGAGGALWFSFEIGPEPESDPLSLLGVQLNRNRITISWQTSKGASYQVQRSTDLQRWTSVGALRLGTGNILNYTQALNGQSSFLRVVIP